MINLAQTLEAILLLYHHRSVYLAPDMIVKEFEGAQPLITPQTKPHLCITLDWTGLILTSDWSKKQNKVSPSMPYTLFESITLKLYYVRLWD